MIRLSDMKWSSGNGRSRISAVWQENDEEEILWFETDKEDREALCESGGEAFVMRLLPYAMRTGQDICCMEPLSERFVHGLNEYLIPSIAAARTCYQKMRVIAPLRAGTGFFGNTGVAVGTGREEWAAAALRNHGSDCLYPLTHRYVFLEEGNVCTVPKEQSLIRIVLYYNCPERLRSKNSEEAGFLELSCALSLRAAAGTYLYCSDVALDTAANLDIMLVSFASTESWKVWLVDCGRNGEETGC